MPRTEIISEVSEVTPSTTVAQATLADPDLLAWLRNLADPEEPSFLADLLELFLTDADKRVTLLRRAVTAGDARGLVRAAHSLKGASASVGAEAVAQACQCLMVYRETPLNEQAAELVQEVEEALERVKAELEKLDISML